MGEGTSNSYQRKRNISDPLRPLPRTKNSVWSASSSYLLKLNIDCIGKNCGIQWGILRESYFPDSTNSISINKGNRGGRILKFPIDRCTSLTEIEIRRRQERTGQRSGKGRKSKSNTVLLYCNVWRSFTRHWQVTKVWMRAADGGFFMTKYTLYY